MTRRSRTLIIGGVAAGMSAATRLRRLDEHRDIVVIERGQYVSFANCGLPYHIGGVIPERDDLLLQTPERLRERFALDVRTRQEAIGIDREQRTVTVRDLRTGALTVERYDELVLATGAAPFRPPIPGVERALTLRSMDDLDLIMDELDTSDEPAATSAVIIGAGFIGLELAENLHRRGLRVAIVEQVDHVLPPLDIEFAGIVQEHLMSNGIVVRTSTAAAAIGPAAVITSRGEKLAADLVVVAAGVTPESTLAVAAGLRLGPRGSIWVDARQRTSDPHIFAVGDVAAKQDVVDGADTVVPLAQTANRHGRLVADAIMGRRVAAQSTLGTAVLGVFGLTVAVTGWSERRLRAAGRAARAIHTHPLDHAGYYPGAAPMALKLMVDPVSDEILGAQGVGGNGVDKRIDVIATAMRGGLRASELADLELAYAPQYGAAKDPVVMLGMIADNLASGLTSTLQWHEVEAARLAGACFVDVRTPAEFADGALPKAVNIPLEELRRRHREIPDGPVVVNCAVGLRGHTAARLLTQLGRPEVANLDGGYRTWLAGVTALDLAAG